MAYIHYEWRELTAEGLFIKISPLLVCVDDGGDSVLDESLSSSFYTEEEAMEAFFEASKKQYRYVERIPDNLTLIKLLDS